jgi:hypothetical protein
LTCACARGAETADPRLARKVGCDIVEPHAIKDLLPVGQVFRGQLCREIAVRSGIAECRAQDGLETIAGRAFEAHARRPIGACPHDRTIAVDIARLDTARDLRPVGGAAEIGFCERTRARERNQGSGADQKLTSGQGRPGASCHSSGNLHRIVMKRARRV